ncbi:Uncharacterised protein [Vibrio cholerae]|uniref:Uncharacterized protein n=1 Tax=Vibrio cholerae TaxID=666 RepID=A0A655YU15_VIBCL|nr:Uncharacterised protein [Vibrio cholerae]
MFDRSAKLEGSISRWNSAKGRAHSASFSSFAAANACWLSDSS